MKVKYVIPNSIAKTIGETSVKAVPDGPSTADQEMIINDKDVDVPVLSFWGDFLSRLNIVDHTNKLAWREALSRPGLPFKYRTWILALAYWDAHSDKPYDRAGIEALGKELGIDYGGFTTHKDELRSQLAMLGDSRVRLVERGRYAFYLRTIARLSGSRYVQFAKSLKSVLAHAALADLHDENRFRWLFLSYGMADVRQALEAEDGEERKSNEEALDFLHRMVGVCERTNRAPSVADIQDEIPVTEAVCQRIIRELVDAVRLDTLPELTLDRSGKARLQFPENPYFQGSPERVVFRFYNDASAEAGIFCRCIYADGSWTSSPSPDFAVVGVPAEGLQRVQKRTISNGAVSGFVDILSELSSDGKGCFALVHVIPETSNLCGYARARGSFLVRPSDRLRPGECYKVICLSCSCLTAVGVVREDGSEIPLPFTAFSADGSATGCFDVPESVEAVEIGGVRFAVHDGIGDLLVADTDRIGCAVNVGRSIVLNATTFPLSRLAVLPPNLKLDYEFEGKRIEIPIAGVGFSDWRVPADILWNRGRLRVRLGRVERAYPMVFVDVDFSSLSKIFDHGEAGSVTVRLGDETRQVPFGAEAEVLPEQSFHGVTFCPRIRRQGVVLHMTDGESERLVVIPRDTGTGPEKIEVALDDFALGEKKRNVEIVSEASDDFEFIQGNCGRRVGDNRSYVVSGCVSGASLVGNHEEFPPEDFASCRFEYHNANGGTDPYRFRLYDPKSTPLPESAYGKSVVYVRSEDAPDDLTVRYFTSYRDYSRKCERVIACYPAHRQDDPPVLIPVDERSVKADEFGRLIETVVARGFFIQKMPQGWGYGLICFSAMKVAGEGEGARYEALTTGFFVGNPNPKEEPFEDRHGLRAALAMTSVLNAYGEARPEQLEGLKRIETVLASSDADVRADIRAYIPRAIRAADRLNVFGSFNSFRNAATRDGCLVWVSGYLFMAGWYLKELLDRSDDGELPAYLSPYWHRSLIGYADRPPKGNGFGRDSVEYTVFTNKIVPYLNDLSDPEYVAWWRESHSALDSIPPGLPTAQLLQIERQVERYVPPLDSCGPQTYCQFAIGRKFGGDETHQFTHKQFFVLLEKIAAWLHNWRKRPSLYGRLGSDAKGRSTSVQELRELLRFLDDLDRQIVAHPDYQNWSKTIFGKVEPPTLFLVESLSVNRLSREASASPIGERA